MLTEIKKYLLELYSSGKKKSESLTLCDVTGKQNDKLERSVKRGWISVFLV
jgi:hypothetical protein